MCFLWKYNRFWYMHEQYFKDIHDINPDCRVVIPQTTSKHTRVGTSRYVQKVDTYCGVSHTKSLKYLRLWFFKNYNSSQNTQNQPFVQWSVLLLVPLTWRNWRQNFMFITYVFYVTIQQKKLNSKKINGSKNITDWREHTQYLCKLTTKHHQVTS